MTRLNETLPFTIKTLRRTLEILCGEGKYSADVVNKAYRLVVRVALGARSSYDNVEVMLGRIAPANMIIDLSLLYNQHKTIGRYTHRQLAEMTHFQIRDEVLMDGKRNNALSPDQA